MTKVYFAGSIRGGRDDADTYRQLIDFLAKQGCAVLTEHIGLKDVKAMGEANRTEQWIYDRDIAWLKQATAVVAEVSHPSLDVGYEIAKAEEWGKPILCLFRPSETRPLSAMIAGSPNVILARYQTICEAAQTIKTFIDGI